MPIALKIAGRTYPFDSSIRRIRIGAAALNEISLPADRRLAAVHTEIRCINGRWIVESRGRDSMRIGNRPPVKFAWLKSGDVFRLTESGPDVVFEENPRDLPVLAPSPAEARQPYGEEILGAFIEDPCDRWTLRTCAMVAPVVALATVVLFKVCLG